MFRIEESRFFTYLALVLITIPFLALTTLHSVYVAVLDMNIDGGALLFIDRVLNTVEKNSILILEIDSYGGYVAAADKIVEKILRSNITCYAWIPPGGKAASAAAYVALACRGIYMGRGSSIGAAIPIPKNEKNINYLASRFRALAERLYRNRTLVDIAEKMVRQGIALSYEQAVVLGFAKPADTLVEILKDLNISSADVRIIAPNAWERFVSLISDPYIASLMLSIGGLLILIEVLTTGFQGYAVAGVLLIIFALYGMTLIPPNLFVLLLLLIGSTLVAIEMYAPSHGAFGIVGLFLMVLGSVMAFMNRPPGTLTSVHMAVIAALAVLAGFVGFIGYKASRVVRMKRPSYEEMLVGRIGIAKTDVEETKPGIVYVANEEWTAFSVRGKISAGSKVRVVRVEGLKLFVEPVEEVSRS